MVDTMLRLARAGPGDTVYDLGSGNGQIVIAAAQRFGARAIGIEIDDDLVALSSARIEEGRLGSRAQILHGDFVQADLRPATIVTLYQLPSVNELLRPKFEAQLRPGARVVSLDFPIPGWSAARVETALLPDGSQHAVFLYSIGQTREVTVAQQRGYSAERFALDLEGTGVGLVKSVEGGAASADVVSEKLGPDGIVHKHVAGVKYDDIAIACGTGMSKAFYAWLSDTMNRKSYRKNGAVVAADFNYQEVSRLNFFHALVSEIGFPALDGGSKDVGSITVKLSPEYTQRQTGKGNQLGASSVKAQKQWLRCNFQLLIDGLDCTKVNKIDAITVRQTVTQNAVGELRDYEQEPAYLDVPNLAVTMPEANAEDFFDWIEDFVIKGNNGQNGEKAGTLEFLGANMKDTFFTLSFHGLGICKVTPLRNESGAEGIRRVRAEMYCEEMSLMFGPNAVSETASRATDGHRDRTLDAGKRARRQGGDRAVARVPSRGAGRRGHPRRIGSRAGTEVQNLSAESYRSCCSW